jgi:myo-inositol 2-dehydrogenase / D-chiro-inositol 1-dehydrogenase
MSDLTRRSFLKTSTIAASATIVGVLDISRGAYAAGSGLIKLGLIGCGGRGSGAASDAMTADPETTLWAAADLFPDKVESSVKGLAAKFGDRVQVDPARRFTGLQGYRNVIENCDYVLIACASRFHAAYALAAAKAKKPVFVEKPAAVDVAGIQQLLEAAELSEKNGTGILGGVTYRYHLGRREAIQRIRNGEIGDLIAIQCDFLRAPYNEVARDANWTELEYQFRNWYHFSWLSGDDIPQSLIHNLDSALWALGDETPLQAYGMGGRSTHFETELGTSFDHHHVIFEYANGRCIYGSCRTAQGCFGSNKDIFHGTKGRCIFKGFSPPQFTDLKGNIAWTADVEASKKSPYVHEHVEFLRSLRDGKPLQTARQLATSTLTTVLGQMAVYSGQRITWKEAMDSKFAFPPHGEVRMDMEPPVKPGPDGIYPVAIPGKTTLV